MAGRLPIGILLAALAAPISCAAAEQPTSKVLEGEQSILFRSTDPDHFNVTTLEVPRPRNAKDSKIGDPCYHWDFGPLHAVSYTPGILSVYSDTDGRYNVTVYCEQIFRDAEGDFYCECTVRSE